MNEIKQAEKDVKQAPSLDKAIVHAEELTLSGDDIHRIIDGKANILPYEQLEDIDDINQILDPFGASVILYQTSENFGHWVGLFKTGKNTLEFFDPYGLRVDQELNLENEFHLRIHQGQTVPHLSTLLSQSRYRVRENKFRLQRILEEVNTCGRHVAMRIRFRDVPLDRYIKLLTKNKAYSPDFWVSSMTLLV